MSAIQQTAGGASADERIARESVFGRLLRRPELGAVGGAIVVWIFFALVAGGKGFLSLAGTASYLEVSAELGILATAVTLLMIGGEFDLSIGSVIGATGMLMTILVVQFGWPVWLAIIMTVLFALGTGYVNGLLVVRTQLPSFIITLATLFIYRGLTIAITRLLTGRTQLSGLSDAPGFSSAKAIFASSLNIGSATFKASVLWWLLIVALATWILLRTSFGNWIFAVGGGEQAAHNVGVPVRRVKIMLFMGTALAACLVAIIQAITFDGADVLRGTNQEFLAIIASVVGGSLLTGGYGSPIGTAFGALILGMVRQGIVFAGVDADWYQVVLGVILMAAVLINRSIRLQALRRR